MKTFWTFLAALLVAGAIFTFVFLGYHRLQVWEQAKNETLVYINSRDATAQEIMADADRSSIESLQSALTIAGRLSRQRSEAVDTLHSLLKKKPFFALNAKEQKFLDEIEGKASPVSQFKLTKPVTVNLSDGPVILEEGVTLQLIKAHGSELTADYNGQSVEIPRNATDLSK
jgi:hypothetical protein